MLSQWHRPLRGPGRSICKIRSNLSDTSVTFYSSKPTIIPYDLVDRMSVIERFSFVQANLVCQEGANVNAARPNRCFRCCR
jgi:hypothetical protein